MNREWINLKKGRGFLKNIITGIVISRGETHGYEIYRELIRIGRGRWKPSIGTIYRVLGEMVEEGCLDKRIIVKGKRKIIYYRATEKGIEEFLKATNEFVNKILLLEDLIVKALDKISNNSREEKITSIRAVLTEQYYLLKEFLEGKNRGE